MANKYNHQESEAKWQKYREEKQIFMFSKDEKKPIYSIDTPPPTVSGKIHIGHIFSYTQAEIIARFKRMSGYNVFYPMGYDNNGIPTEQLVEKELGINIKDIERKDFIEKCLDVVEKYKVIYSDLRKSLGLSIDWNRTYTTISSEVQQIAQSTFVKLYGEWHIVCKDFPALRCTKMQTTVAQAETEEQEFNEYFNYLNFTLDCWGKLVIATTRPELLPACRAVFVHPDDERFAKYVGKTITTPIGVSVPVLADDKVKMDKGTGVVMCCSYGDEVDVYWIKKHNLWEKIVIDRYGKMQNTGVPEIDGLKISEAREKIMELFDSTWWIIEKRDPIVQSKQISERGKVPVEILPVKQWFVNLLDKKELLLVQNDKMQWHPEFMKKRSNDWIENLQWDRNVSRSRKYGIPIPVRYNVANEEMILPSAEQLARGPIDPTSELPDGYTAEQVRGETLVLDTWFTSWLTPQINQKYLERDGYTQKILPMNLRPQAHDIIRTWLLYTTLQSYFATGEVAFHDVMMSWFCLAQKGEKFSKSKGNAKFDPEQVIATRWADAVRYRASGGQLGKDILFDENEFKIGQKLITKLRNAANFVFMNLSDFDQQTKIDEKDLYPIDLRILNQINATSKSMTEYLNDYEYGQAKLEFEKFFRHDFCDNYLEIVKEKIYKPEKYADGQKQKISAQFALYHTFAAIIKLIAPYLPFITEELYQTYYKDTIKSESIHTLSFPNNDVFSITQDVKTINAAVEELLTIIEKVRGYKTEKQLWLWTELAHLTVISKNDLSVFADDIMSGTRAVKISFQTGETNITVE